MNQKQKMYLIEGLVILAYAYTLSGYQAASSFIGVLTLALSIYAYSFETFKKEYIKILVMTFVQLLLIHLLKLQIVAPTISFLAFVNTAVSCLMMNNIEEDLFSLVKVMFPMMLTFIIITCAMPIEVLRFFIASRTSGFLEMFFVICLVFMPYQVSYIIYAFEKNHLALVETHR